ncbi:hypothetical protein EDB19DRAFT_1686572 [Suillus lakei]|nr:hypothetical protein EDB19DRAFT_1686572 [Suillus lakei]
MDDDVNSVNILHCGIIGLFVHAPFPSSEPAYFTPAFACGYEITSSVLLLLEWCKRCFVGCRRGGWC